MIKTPPDVVKNILKYLDSLTNPQTLERPPVRMRHYTRVSTLGPIAASNTITANYDGVFAVPAGKTMSPIDVQNKYGLLPGKGSAYVDFDTQAGEFQPQRNNLTGVTEYVYRGSVSLIERNPTYHLNSGNRAPIDP